MEVLLVQAARSYAEPGLSALKRRKLGEGVDLKIGEGDKA
jgi:hypothetical protein